MGVAGWINGVMGHFGLRIYQESTYAHSLMSYSQEGEDLILRRIFDGQPSGFYVDIGAHHPQRFSNTYFFYVRGWRGINVDAMPGCMDIFNQVRPNDINIEAAIAREKRELTYYMFDEPALNSFDPRLSQKRDKTAYHIIGEKKMFTKTLAEVLDDHAPSNQTIDFLTIDVEGLDLEVLESNNWDKYRPLCVLAECVGESLEEIERNEIYQYLNKKKYDLFAKTTNTFLFKSS